jgi:hypothetical protein
LQHLVAAAVVDELYIAYVPKLTKDQALAGISQKRTVEELLLMFMLQRPVDAIELGSV